MTIEQHEIDDASGARILLAVGHSERRRARRRRAVSLPRRASDFDG
jgi:hypothetical protein